MNKAYVNKKQIQVLGYGGLIPFYGCVLAVYYSNNPDFWIFALHSYAVVIAAFLGAISWGVVLESEQISVG
ncbi:MAG: DUF3429 domain-containing protein, partial [Proteobacteria bacterium]|nr:DUF3429 domain-containing protein [Pseudomonadota bacterium]